VFFGEGNKAKIRCARDGCDGHSPIGAFLRHRGRDCIMRSRLVPVPVWASLTEQAVNQDARASPLIAIDHDAGGIGDCRTHSLFGTQTLKTLIAFSKHDSLHTAPARHQFEPLSQKRYVVSFSPVVEQMDRRKIAFAAFRGRQSAETANRNRTHSKTGPR